MIFDKYETPFDQKAVRFCIGISRYDIEQKAKDASFINRIGATDTALYINRGTKLPSFIKIDYESGAYEYTSTSPFIIKLEPHPIRELDIKKSPGGVFIEYFKLMRIDDTFDQILILTFLLSKFFPERQSAILHIIGSKNTGKTTFAWSIRQILDPEEVGVIPSKKDELVQLFDHSAIPVLDNLGNITKEFSNTLCQMVTGSSLLKRTIYSNDKDFIFRVMNSPIFTSLELPNLAADLISRTFFIMKKEFAHNDIRSDKVIRNKAKEMQPFLLDELVYLYLQARKLLPNYDDTEGNERNMDFFILGKIVCSVVYQNESLMDEIVTRNNLYKTNAILSTSHEAAAVIEFMADKPEYVGTPTKLIAELDAFGCSHNQYNRYAVHFSRNLRMSQDILNEKGIEFVDNNTHGKDGRVLILINHNFVESNGEVLSCDYEQSIPQ
jgi:hypothetical protein